MAFLDFRGTSARLLASLVILLTLVLFVSPPNIAFAITWCHDFTYYKLTGQDRNHTSLKLVRGYLREQHYSCYPYKKVPALHPGDVVIFGTEHSGVVDKAGLIESYFESRDELPIPGRSRSPETISASDLHLMPVFSYRSGSNAEPVEKILSDHPKYKAGEVVVCRKENPDKVFFSWSKSPYRVEYAVDEDAGEAAIKIAREGTGMQDVTVDIEAQPVGSAKEGDKFTLKTKTLKWENGQAFVKDLIVFIKNDDREEGSQEVILRLKNVRGNAVLVWPTEAHLIIKDKDMGGQIGFVQDRITVDEKSREAVLLVQRQGFTKGRVTVEYQTHDGTAKAGTAYSGSSGTFTWEGADNTLRGITIPLIDRAQPPGGSTFSVVLKNPTHGAHIAGTGTATVSIEGGSGTGSSPGSSSVQKVEFAQGVFEVRSYTGKAVVTVNRIGGKTGQLTVGYLSENRTAVSGKDYIPVSGTLTWGKEDDRPQTFEVPLLPGDGTGGRRVILLTLENPGNDATTAQLGYQWQAEIHILTDDPLRGPPPPERPHLDRIVVNPGRTTLKPNETVTFRATAFYSDGSTEDVTGRAVWQPGPANTYTAPGNLRFDQQVTITSTFQEVRGSAEVFVEIPDWTPAISHADRTGSQAQPATPEMYTWYAACRKSDGIVVYCENPDRGTHWVMGGPFEGPRTARWWIDTNCPSWLCEAGTGKCATKPRTGSPVGGSYVLCEKNTGQVTVSRNSADIANSSRFAAMAGPFFAERDAFQWIQGNCPNWRCTSAGKPAVSPAAAPTGVEGYYVLCNKRDGSIVYGKNQDFILYFTMAGPLLSGSDALLWIKQNCPSGTCNPETGACVSGLRSATTGGGGYWVLCKRNTGEVVYGTDNNAASYISLGGPFLGAVAAERFIGANYPSGRCDPSTGRAVGGMPGQTPAEVLSLFDQREQQRSSRAGSSSSTTTTGTTGSTGTATSYSGVAGSASTLRQSLPAETGTGDQSSRHRQGGTSTPTTKTTTTPVSPSVTSPVTTTKTTTPSVPTTKPSSTTTLTPMPAMKWYVWHNCESPGWWCILMLTRTTEESLRKANKKVTILGSYATEQEALQTTCSKMTGFYTGGYLSMAPGVMASIGSDRYCVREFGWYDNSQKKWNCRQSKQ